MATPPTVRTVAVPKAAASGPASAMPAGASTGSAVTGLIGPPGSDATGVRHPGLPWAGCTVLTAGPAALAGLRAKAATTDGVLVVDMPASAQTNRVYDGYLAELAQTKPDDLAVSAVSIIAAWLKSGVSTITASNWSARFANASR